MLGKKHSISFDLIEKEVKTMLEYYKIGLYMLEVKRCYDGWYNFRKDENIISGAY